MNKKQRNRKLVAQNKRNRIINRRYSSTIKSIFKLFLFKLKSSKMDFKNQLINNLLPTEIATKDVQTREKLKKELLPLVNGYYSIVDKAHKKNVIHLNTAAKKKSRIAQIFNKI